MRRSHRGAALLTAMLTVTLVATFASAALWQQWRGIEIEAAERSRTQMQWVLNGALDWARLILQEDGRDNRIDHLSEPWSLALQEARLSSFLATDRNNTNDALDAFLSGEISDQQARLNLRNLVQAGKPNATAQPVFERLFNRLGLAPELLQRLIDALLADAVAKAPAASSSSPAAAAGSGNSNVLLSPNRLDELVWLGFSPAQVQALRPYATLLPSATPLNLNTASAEVLQAAIAGLGLSQAEQMVRQRATTPFKTVGDALQASGLSPAAIARVETKDLDVATRYFAVRGRLRLGADTVQEVSLVERSSNAVTVVWRQREAPSAPSELQAASLQ